MAENIELTRLKNPELETRPQPEREAQPTPFQKQQERDGRSEWSGGSGGGGTWAGRSR